MFEELLLIEWFDFNNNKKKLLIYVGGFYNNGIINFIINLFRNFDINKYELVFVDYLWMCFEKEYNMNCLFDSVYFIFNFLWVIRIFFDIYN